MNKLLVSGLVVALLTPAAVLAQSAIDGTWKIDVNKAQMPKKPDVYVLQNGMYQCKTCVPPFSVKADGEDHKVSGNPYFDTAAEKIVDDRTVEETLKKDGKVYETDKVTLAPDGKTGTVEFTSNTSGAPVTGQVTIMRVAKGPAGSHATSGSWRTASIQSVSDSGLSRTYKTERDSLSMTDPAGDSYTAKMDGSDAPYKGDPGITSISVKKMGANTIQETEKRDGKVINVTETTVAPDGKTAKIVVHDKLHGTTISFVANKQ